MAIVIPHRSETGISVASGGSGGQYKSASDFVTPGQAAMPGALGRLAEGVNRVGGALLAEELQTRQEAQNLELITDMQALQADAQTFGDEFRRQNQGRDAIGAEEAANAFYKDKLDGYRQKWAGNDRALAIIERQGGGIANAGINALRDYGRAQLEAYKDSTFASDRALFMDVAKNLASTPQEIGAAYAAFTPRYEAYLRGKGLDDAKARVEAGRVLREAMDERTQYAFFAALEREDIPGAQTELAKMKGGDAADFAAQFESGAMGSYAIGHDRTGGTSYGKYQLSSRAGTMGAFIAWARKNGHSAAAAALAEAGPDDTGSRKGAMPNAWRALVDSGAITEEMQDAFIREKFVDPAVQGIGASARKAVESDPALMRALFSTAVQHGPGGAKALINKAWDESGGDREAFLDALYAARKGQFASSDPEVRRNMAARMDRERGMVDARASIRPDIVARYETRLEIARNSLACRAMEPDAAIDWAVKNIPDGEVQASVIAQTRKRAELEEWQKRRDVNARLEAAYDGIREAATPREAQDIIDSFPPEEQGKLNVAARRRFSGELTITDEAKKGEFITRLANGDTNINVKAEYGEYFSDMDMAWAEKTLAREEKKTRLVNASKLFDIYATDAGIKKTEEKNRAKAEFYGRVDRENADTAEKQRAILFDMFRQVTWRIEDVPDGELIINARVRDMITRALERADKPVTEENIRRVYLANRKREGWL